MKSIVFPILSFFLLFLSQGAKAHDFAVLNNGDSIYYKVISSTSPYSVMVSYRGNTNTQFTNEYSDTIFIPNTVSFNGITYSVSKIDSFAFSNCNILKMVYLADSIKSVGKSAFENCSGLRSVYIPSSVISIGDYAFFNCSSMDSVFIPSSIAKINEGTFYYCYSLSFVSIPSSVSSIGRGAFYGCGNLKSILIPDSVTLIDNSAFSYCGGLTMVTLPSHITKINDAVFKECTGLKSISINAPIISIGANSFYHCVSLDTIIVPNSVKVIGKSAFQECNRLKYIDFGVSLDSIGNSAFSNCDSLRAIKSRSINPPKINFVTFSGASLNIAMPIYVSCCSVGLYQSAQYWKIFTNFQGVESAIPSNLALNKASNFFELRWSGDAPSYVVFRNNDSIALISDTIFRDTNVIDGINYCYKVKAMDCQCNSDFSQELCQIFSGINNTMFNNTTISLYPNPTNGFSTLRLNEIFEETSVVVYGIDGQKINIYKIKPTNQEQEIVLSGLPQGLYFINVSSNRINKTLKLIVY